MNDSSIQRLMQAVRVRCSPQVWSRAVEFARTNPVISEERTDDEVRVRLRADNGFVNPSVVFWPDEDDFWCDCDQDSDEGCVHAAAAIIGLRQASKQGKPVVPQAEAAGRLSYRFRRTPSGLAFDRYIVTKQGPEAKLGMTLSAAAEGRAGVPTFVADPIDLEVERAIGSNSGTVVPRLVLPRLLRALSGCGDVRLDDRPVRVTEPAAPVHGVVEDCAEGFRLSIEQARDIDEVFANGVVRCGETLREVGEPNLTARELEELRAGRVFARDKVAELLTDVLPQLRQRVPVRVAAKRLPQVNAALVPRLVVETRREGNELVVLPTLVYGKPPVARVDGDRLTHLQGELPARKPDAEQRLVRRLRELGMRVGVRLVLGPQDAIELAARLGQVRDKELEVKGEAFRSFHVAPALRADLRVVGDDFTLHFWSEDDRAGKRVGHADASSVVRAWQRGESLVPLLEGGFAPLPADWLHRFGERIADLLAAREAAGGANRLPRSALPDLARLCAELEQPAPPGFERLRTLVDDFTGISAAALPEDLTATLRSYQRTGIDWLSFLRDAELGALLADDMGLGKTLQVLCALRGRCLVVVPTSVLHGWAEQMRRFRPALSFATYHGPGRCLDSAAEVTLTTYAILRLDIEQLATVPWDAVVLDEAQAIKNSDSQVAQAAYRLRARFRVAMTGTPVENRLDELWSQLHFVNRGLLGGRSDFQNRLVKPIVEGDVQAAARLREKTRPFVLRRLKREVAPELPPRTEVVLRCELNASEAQLYQSIWAATRQDVVERLRAGGSVMAALEALLRLRQAACHPALLPGQQAATSSKVELLLETLERTLAGGHKSLVFSQWTTYLDLIEPHLQRLGVPYGRLDGATRDREAVVQAFQAASGPPLLLVSLRAGGTGLNLTAADHVFLLDPWWNPAVEDQAADRAHRIGQDKPVMVYKLVAEQTVEERILELQQTKRAVAELAVGEAAPSAGLTRDDLLAMLA